MISLPRHRRRRGAGFRPACRGLSPGRRSPAEYSLVVEAIREGYELHYGTPRVLAGQDEDLALLAGDYLYALGLERLAALGDPRRCAELSDLISLCAASHAEGAEATVPALWLAAALAVGCGAGEAHRAAKAAAAGHRSGRSRGAAGRRRSKLLRRPASRAIWTVRRNLIDFAIPRPADSG